MGAKAVEAERKGLALKILLGAIGLFATMPGIYQFFFDKHSPQWVDLKVDGIAENDRVQNPRPSEAIGKLYQAEVYLTISIAMNFKLF